MDAYEFMGIREIKRDGRCSHCFNELKIGTIVLTFINKKGHYDPVHLCEDCFNIVYNEIYNFKSKKEQL